MTLTKIIFVPLLLAWYVLDFLFPEINHFEEKDGAIRKTKPLAQLC